MDGIFEKVQRTKHIYIYIYIYIYIKLFLTKKKWEVKKESRHYGVAKG